jgi:hypothetical protein
MSTPLEIEQQHCPFSGTENTVDTAASGKEKSRSRMGLPGGGCRANPDPEHMPKMPMPHPLPQLGHNVEHLWAPIE